jgi:parvulin-like peptidyl-prolyl isomerase
VKILKEPIVQFGLLAALLFGYFSLIDTPQRQLPKPEQLDISQTDVMQLVATFEATWKRKPSPSELANLVEDKIREEILVREALAMGLDQGDAVIRNRLRQKMQFISESVARSAEPSDAELQTFLDEHGAEFQQPAQVAFRQVFLGQEVSQVQIDAALAELQHGQIPTRQPSLLPETMPLTGLPQVNRTFGDGFGDSLMGLPTGEWSGPVQSGYGSHLVWVEAYNPARTPDLDAVRDKVQSAWYHAQAKTFAQAQMDALMQSYEITRPTDDELLRMVAQ